MDLGKIGDIMSSVGSIDCVSRSSSFFLFNSAHSYSSDNRAIPSLSRMTSVNRTHFESRMARREGAMDRNRDVLGDRTFRIYISM